MAEAAESVAVDGTYTVTCSDGFMLNPAGDGVMTCEAGGAFDISVTCEEEGTVLFEYNVGTRRCSDVVFRSKLVTVAVTNFYNSNVAPTSQF